MEFIKQGNRKYERHKGHSLDYSRNRDTVHVLQKKGGDQRKCQKRNSDRNLLKKYYTDSH